ncbi:hypothetical protein KO06_14530, partial [Listeria monocytogenes]
MARVRARQRSRRAGRGEIRRIDIALNRMVVLRHFALQQCHGGGAAVLAQDVGGAGDALPLLHRRIALHVGQREVAPAVAAVSGAEQGEQRGVLRDRHQLAVAEGPSLGRKIEREYADLGQEWIRHGPVLGFG